MLYTCKQVQRREKMQQTSHYTWSYLYSANRARSVRICTSMNAHKQTPATATFYDYWENPPVAPPTDPLKYRTPQKYRIMGDTGWNPT